MTEDPTEAELAISFIAGVCAVRANPMLVIDDHALRSLADEYARTHIAEARKRGVTVHAAIAIPGLAEILKPSSKETP